MNNNTTIQYLIKFRNINYINKEIIYVKKNKK